MHHVPRRLPVRPLLAFFLIGSAVAGAAEPKDWPEGLERVRENAEAPLTLVEGGRAAADVAVTADNELLTNAAAWLSGFVERVSDARLPMADADALEPGRAHLVAAVGREAPRIERLVEAGKLQLEPRVGEQGYVIQRVDRAEGRPLLVCWSPSELGCRYGLIDVLRSLKVSDGTVRTPLQRVVERPRFPKRILYHNFAAHLLNAYNANVVAEKPVQRWSLADWKRVIDMASAFRFNVFEFWLVPSLFSPESLEGGERQAAFAETMRKVIDYAHRRGVRVHAIATNCVGAERRNLCPNAPDEHRKLVRLWDHWVGELEGVDSVGFFPGDPGGCRRNGCTAETFVDLSLELSEVVREDRPGLNVEVNTWGSPFAGWGVELWEGTPARAERSMNYLIEKLPQFPPGTFASINLGFSPDGRPTHGGNARPYARRAAKIVPVLTWDYFTTAGETTVTPRCRARRIFRRRREEASLGFYSGGISYTMAPQLDLLNIFSCAEAYWNPQRDPDRVLQQFGRWVFGREQAAIGPLLEELEIVPGWGYEPPFEYSPQRLKNKTDKLLRHLRDADAPRHSRLPLAVKPQAYTDSLQFFADLMNRCATAVVALQEATDLAGKAGKLPEDRDELISRDRLASLVASEAPFPQKDRLAQLLENVRQVNMRRLRKRYWKTVYGIYDRIEHRSGPNRAAHGTRKLFRRFHYDKAVSHEGDERGS